MTFEEGYASMGIPKGDFDVEVVALKQKIEDLKDELWALQSTLEDKQQRIDAMQRTIDDLLQANGDCVAANEQYKNRIEELEGALREILEMADKWDRYKDLDLLIDDIENKCREALGEDN